MGLRSSRVGIAWEPQLSFSLPSFARGEAVLLHPATEPLIETLAQAPYVVLADLRPADAAAIDTRQQAAGVFDPPTSWVVHAYHQRGWPAISANPGHLRRIDPDLPIDLL